VSAAHPPDSETREPEHVLQETEDGVFGLQEVIRDFDEADLARLRQIAAVIRTPPREGVRTAMALAGSAAQSKFQLFPGDCDFFERVHIQAPDREAALDVLVAAMVETVARVFPHPQLQFTEMKLGLHPDEVLRDGEALHRGTPISWTLAEVDARAMPVQDASGAARMIALREVAADPGFVKLDWVYADPDRDRVIAVTKVLDATWEGPDGAIVALDGVLDSFYQEVYLDPESRVDVERLIAQVRPDGLVEYTDQLESEIRRYSDPEHANYGKVAKRLYNLARVYGNAASAAHLRALFGDPPARLYQVPTSLFTLNVALNARRLDPEAVSGHVADTERILRECYTGADGEELAALVRALPGMAAEEREAATQRISDHVNEQVSDYFQARIAENAELQAYLDSLRGAAPAP